MAVRNLQFVLSGNDKSASKTFDKVGRKADGLGSKLAGIGKAAAFGVGGVAVAAVGGLAAAMVNGIKDAQAYQELALKSAAAIKSTGNAAGTSVKDIQKLAGELESLSGVDEELIINGQNVLLTFTKIQNKVGKGNDIFDRATEAALNMSVALGQDMQGSVTMLGKALNDPIKGISAMGRAGVQFTEQQKQQIKALVKSGKTLEAQKIILAELETQFGGVAKAAGSGLTGSIARAKDAFGDLFRNIATPLLPKIAEWAEKFAEKVNNDIAPAIMRFIDQFERGVGPGGEFRDQLKSLGDSAKEAWPHIKKAFEWTKDIVDFVIKHKDAFTAITAGVVAYWGAMKLAALYTGTMAAINLVKLATGIGGVGAASAAAAPGIAAAGGAAGAAATSFGLLAAALGAAAGAYAIWKLGTTVTDGGGNATFAPFDPNASGGTNTPGYKAPVPALPKGTKPKPTVYYPPSADFPSSPRKTKSGDSNTDRPRQYLLNADGYRLTSAVSQTQGGRLARGYVPAY